MRPIPNEPAAWWGWCSICGQRWAERGCTHDSNEPFPDPEAAHAAGLLGGADAVHAIERQLWSDMPERELSKQIMKHLAKKKFGA